MAEYKISWGFEPKHKVKTIDGESKAFVQLVGGYTDDLSDRYLGGGICYVLQSLKDYYNYAGNGTDVFKDCFDALLIIIRSLDPSDPITPYRMFFLRHQLRRLANEFYDYYHSRYNLQKVNHQEYPVSTNYRRPSYYMQRKRRSPNA